MNTMNGWLGMGTAFCEPLDVARADLAALLDSAKSAGLLTVNTFSADEGDPIAVEAQKVYKDTNYFGFIPIGSGCEESTARVQAASARMRTLLEEHGASIPAPAQPNYVAPSSNELIPSWLKFVLIGGVVLYGATLVMPFIRPRRRMSGYRRRRRR